MNKNPFTFGNPISAPSRFYGRKQEQRQIVNRLLSSAHESTSVVGERRIGKTSLLKYLTNSQVASGLGLTKDRFCLIYIDFQGLTDITPRRFWERVLYKMGRSICMPELATEIEAVQQLGDFDLFDLEDLFEGIGKHGLTTVLFMDEFEYVTQNPNFGADFFGGLRALAIHHNLPLVTATRRELVDLCHSEEIKGSPFFNIFANVVLRPFSREQVLEMLNGYLCEVDLQVSESEKELVIQLAGGHPFFVQMAGNYLLDAKYQGIHGDALLQEIIASFDAQAGSHYDYLWSHCSDSEKITMLAVISLHRQKPSKKSLPTIENLVKIHSRASLDIHDLIKRGLLLEDPEQGNYRLFSPSFERWIVIEISAPPGEEESLDSVQKWLLAGGRQELEPVSGVLPKFKKQYWPIVSTVMLELSLELLGSVAWDVIRKGVI